MIKVTVMFIDYLENGIRDVKGMKMKAKTLENILKSDGLTDSVVVDQNKEKGHEWFSCDFYVKCKRIKKVFKRIKHLGAYSVRTYWNLDE